MRQPVLLFILKGEMDCTETADRRLGSSVQLTLTDGMRRPVSGRDAVYAPKLSTCSRHR